MGTNLSLWEPDIEKILRQRRKHEKKRKCSAFYRPSPKTYRDLVERCSAVEVMNELRKRLKHLTPYQIKEKCFKRIPGPDTKQTLPRTPHDQNVLSPENTDGKESKEAPVFLHDTPKKDQKKESSLTLEEKLQLLLERVEKGLPID